MVASVRPRALHAVPAARWDGVAPNLPTLAVMACVFVPIIVISLLGWHYAGLLEGVVPIELTNFDSMRVALHGLLHTSIRPDSWGPMLQALQVLRGPERESLYQALFFDGHVRFQYPPTSLLSVDLLSALGIGTVRALNAINALVYFLNAAVVGTLVWVIYGAPGRTGTRITAPVLPAGWMAGIAVAATFVFYPYLRADVLGQIQLWIDLMFSAAVLAWILDRRLLAGALIGLACTIKPQFALMLLWGLLWREWAFSSGFVITFIPLGLLSVLRYGFHVHVDYLNVLSFLSQHGEGFFANNSVNGILNGYFSTAGSLHWDDQNYTPYNPIVYAGTLAASLASLAVIAILPLLNRHRRPELSDLGVATICTIVGSPVAWEHHYGLLFPLFAIALKYLMDRPADFRRGMKLGYLAVSWVLVADFIPFGNLAAGTAFSIVQSNTFFGALMLAFLLYDASRRGSAPSSFRT